MNFIKYRPYFLLALFTLIPTLIIWFAFYFNLPRLLGFPAVSLETIFSNYDGPNYMIIAKCNYDKTCIGQNFSLPLPLEYYPAHLPGYPLLIRYFSLYTTTPKGMLLATLAGSILLTLTSYKFFRNFLNTRKSFWLAVLMIFFPARLFVLRLVGAPESWFLSFILLSIISFKDKKWLASSIFGSLALMLKSPGIILFGAYGVLFVLDWLKNKKLNLNYLLFLLIPLTGIAIFYYYFLQTGDFLAYFHSGDNIHLSPFPYQVFVSNRSWINTIWLEDVVYIFLIAFVGIYRLRKKYTGTIIYIFPLLFIFATVLVGHRDISRYISPVYPFLLLAFSKWLTRKSFKLFFWMLLPAILLFAVNFLIGNTAPISNWAPYL